MGYCLINLIWVGVIGIMVVSLLSCILYHLHKSLDMLYASIHGGKKSVASRYSLDDDES